MDLKAAEELGLKVVRVPAYSPESVAEHTVGLMLTLNRRIHKAYQRTRDTNFRWESAGFQYVRQNGGHYRHGKIDITQPCGF